MFVNIIRSHRDIVAICDSELIGKRFEEGKFQLDIKENFYKGEKMSKEEVKKIMQNLIKEDATFNIVGTEATNTAIETGIISEKAVKKIQGIPFAMKLL